MKYLILMKLPLLSNLFLVTGILTASFFVVNPQTASAQRTTQPGDFEHILDHTVPPGRAGRWSAVTNRINPHRFQQASVQVEGGGTVTLYDAMHPNGIQMTSPARAGFQVGHVYRLKISNIPQMPGVSVYPSIELLDQLHPPQGKANQFAIPIVITKEEIRLAIKDRMVTKVIYLEQPQLANPRIEKNEQLHTETLPHRSNLIAAADERGRPLMLFRMGGRTPDPRNAGEMFGTRGTIQLAPPAMQMKTTKANTAKPNGIKTKQPTIQQTSAFGSHIVR